MSWERILEIDHRLFDWLNLEEGSVWLDATMRIISGHWLWLVAALIFFILRKHLNGTWDFKLLGVCGIGIAITDALNGLILKASFARLRPCKDPEVVSRIVDGCAGTFGFPSNHAANSMVVCALLCFLVPGQQARFILLIPLLIGYSRIYLGVHYPGDVLAGFFVGFSIAFILKKSFSKHFIPKLYLTDPAPRLKSLH